MKSTALSNGGGGNIWTPRWLVEEHVRRTGYVYGLDVAACAASSVAPRHYDEEMNALELPWCGRFWLQPPWDSATIRAFVVKAIEELQRDRKFLRSRAGTALVPCKLDTLWWRTLVEHAELVEIINPRLNYYYPEGWWTKGKDDGPDVYHPPGLRSGIAYPSAFVYLTAASAWDPGPTTHTYVEYRKPKGAKR